MPIKTKLLSFTFLLFLAVLSGCHSSVTSSQPPNDSQQSSATQTYPYSANSLPDAKTTETPDTQINQTIVDEVKAAPQHIALLLPIQGSMALAAQTIYRGILASYYQQLNAAHSTPTLRWYDTSEARPILKFYQEAVAQGADLIIGPLEKPRVKELLLDLTQANNTQAVPILALNYSRDLAAAPPLYFYQFGLAIEDELQQIAKQAFTEGYHNALVITPAGMWGERTYKTFATQWHGFNGTATQLRFTESTLSTAVEQALKPTSQERGSGFKRRQTIDFIVLIASPADARRIKPALNFYYAEDLPVFATSYTYSGLPDPADSDLESIRFCEMPWVLTDTALSTAIQQTWPYHSNEPIRLYALGIDAYNLSTAFPAFLTRHNSATFSGSSGMLQLNATGQIERELLWAQFHQGQVAILPLVSPTPSSEVLSY